MRPDVERLVGKGLIAIAAALPCGFIAFNEGDTVSLVLASGMALCGLVFWILAVVTAVRSTR